MRLVDVLTTGASNPDRLSVRTALEVLQDRLHGHFQQLRVDRDALSPGAPIFALEHGMAEGDLEVLQSTVRASVWLRIPPRSNWLPFVVHAAEVGYRYEGDEYWPTLEAQTPGWSLGLGLGRDFVKTRFKDFAQSFGGAAPSGRWASQFTIICWPITHAILPTDLQRQLARLLYDYRTALTEELLETPSKLGLVLSARCFNSSKRFQQFAENTDLLGHVAAALLSNSPATSLLLPSTLKRITADLSEEREARRWLRDARASADQVRLRGMSRTAGPHGSGQTRSALPRPTAPVTIAAHCAADGWQLRLRVPDLSPLLARFPSLRDELATARCTVVGTAGRPRPRGWLLYSGQEARLDKWPGRDEPAFQLEKATEFARASLAQEARTPPSERWLFRLGSDGAGRLVRSGLVHASTSYLIVSEPFQFPNASWIWTAPCELSGAQALRVDVPAVLDEEALARVTELGCGVQTSVELNPIGLVPASWDGDGFAEFLAGERPLLAVSSSHQISTCAVSVDGSTSAILNWPEDETSMFLGLPTLPLGWHDVRLSFLVSENTPPVPEGRLEILVREPEVGRASGTFREPLQIVVSPPSASLEDIWDGRASIEVNGPSRLETRLHLSLAEHDGPRLASHSCSIRLPMDSASWSKVRSDQLRGIKVLSDVYDEAMQLTLEIDDPDFGYVFLSAERDLQPLRWGFKRSRGRTRLRLFESGDTGDDVTLQRYSFERPAQALSVPYDGSNSIGEDDGGLFVARCGTSVVSAVLPKHVAHLEDLRNERPRVTVAGRSANALAGLLRLANVWERASTPGDVWVEMSRQRVLDAFVAELSSQIGGARWASVEARFRQDSTPSVTDLERGLAKPGNWRAFRGGVSALAGSDLQEPPVSQLAKLLGAGTADIGAASGGVVSSATRRVDMSLPGAQFAHGGRRLADLVLRLASAPWAIEPSDEQSLHDDLAEILEHPLAYRAARLLALSAASQERSWSWE